MRRTDTAWPSLFLRLQVNDTQQPPGESVSQGACVFLCITQANSLQREPPVTMLSVNSTPASYDVAVVMHACCGLLTCNCP